MSRVVVLGANGRTGRSVVEEARRAGHNVTAAVRSPENVDPATDPRPGTLTVVRADVRDPDDVRAAVAGHDVVVSTVGPPGVRPSRLYSDTAQALVSAMTVTGVRRLIAMSSAGVRHDDPDFALWYRVVAGTLLRELYSDMRRMESLVAGSDLDWTFVRPTRITDDAPTGGYRVEDGATPPRGKTITRIDLARFIVDELTVAQWSHAAPTLAT